MRTVLSDLGAGIARSGLLPLLLLSNNRELLPIQALVLASVPEHLTGDARFQQMPERPAEYPELLAAGIDAMAVLLPGRRRRAVPGYPGLVAALAARSGLAGAEAERAAADPAAAEQALCRHHHVHNARDVARALADLPPDWHGSERRALECVLRLGLLRHAKRKVLASLAPAPDTPPATVVEPEPPLLEPPAGPQARRAADAAATPGAVPEPPADWAGRRLADLRRLAAAAHGYLPDLGALGATLFPPCTILLAGRRGSGRATLAQALTGTPPDAAQEGAPREATVRVLARPSGALQLLGLDLAAADAGDALATLLAQRGRRPDIAWLCIDEQNPAIDAGERAAVRALAEAGVPVLIAVTKSWSARAIAPTLERIFPQAEVVHRIVAAPRFDDGGRLIAARGLEALVRDTLHRLPARKRHAFAAGQQVLWDPRIEAARAVMRRAMAAASAAAATPVPFADAVALVPIQIAMLTGISRTLGLALDQAATRAVAAAALGCTASTLGGRALAAGLGNLAKLVPGVGTMVGGAINSAVAAGVTRMLGEAYLEFVSQTLGRKGRLPEPAEIIAHLRTLWRRPAA